MSQESHLQMDITANIRLEDGSYWADVPALPGCFAAGATLDELVESLQEGIALYLADDQPDSDLGGPLRITSAVLSDAASA